MVFPMREKWMASQNQCCNWLIIKTLWKEDRILNINQEIGKFYLLDKSKFNSHELSAQANDNTDVNTNTNTDKNSNIYHQ